MSGPRLTPVTAADRPVVERLWQLYRHDMSELVGLLPDEHGAYPPGRLPRYLDDADCCGYLVHDGDDPRPLGFSFVKGLTGDRRSIGDFFVVRGVRRQGVGGAVARRTLRAHPGDWEIAFQDANTAAARFWRAVAEAVAAGPVSEERRPVPDRPELPPDCWLTFRL